MDHRDFQFKTLETLKHSGLQSPCLLREREAQGKEVTGLTLQFHSYFCPFSSEDGAALPLVIFCLMTSRPRIFGGTIL